MSDHGQNYLSDEMMLDVTTAVHDELNELKKKKN